jgi:peptidoglycan/xylan/chitin deacetylase (PgdA/CDA1 family)
VIALFLGPLQARAITHPGTPVGTLIQPIVERWEELGPQDQARAAELLAVLDYREPRDLLRRCASEDGPLEAQCLMTLAVHRDREAAPLFRARLRQSLDPRTVAVAAMALGAWEDHHSYDLLVGTLLGGRGGGLGGWALLMAIDALDGPWKHVYLRLAHRLSGPGLLRLALASRLIDLAPEVEKGALVAELRDALVKAARDPDGPARRDRIRLAVWGLSRGDEVARRALVGLDPSLLAGAAVAGFPAPESLGASFLKADRAFLEDLQASFGLWPDRETVERLAWVLEDAHARLAPGIWTPFAIPELTGPGTVRRLSQAELEAIGATERFPDSFDGYTPAFAQPSWWPPGMQLTIDDGPRPEVLPGILAALDRHAVKATFFFVGAALARRWLEAPRETRELLERLLAAGHAIGYHSMNHLTEPADHMKSWALDQVVDGVDAFRIVLDVVLGRTVRLLVGRVPGGSESQSTRLRLAFHAAGLQAPVRWNAGAPAWVRGTSYGRLQGLACASRHQAEPAVVLLHEYERLAWELGVFLTAVEQGCPPPLPGPSPARARHEVAEGVAP